VIRPRAEAALALFLTACGGFREIPIDDSCFVYVVAGDSHTCGRKTDGTLWCWGDNQYGQLGTGDTAPHSRPVRVEALGNQVAGVYLPSGTGDISTRTAFSCALKTEGSLYCWGNNEYGQLGTGDANNRLDPARVDVLVHAASLGSGFACARKNDNSIWCWGANESGQLGTGDTQSRSRPVEVAPETLGGNARYLSTGSAHACARKLDATIVCWGENGSGQLGTGTTERSLVPVPVDMTELAENADVIATGGEHSCAAKSDSTVFCWGANQFGRLGIGDTRPRLLPRLVSLEGFAGGVPRLTTGGHHSCAAIADGSIRCWGNNRAGQLGDGSKMNRSLPHAVDAHQLGMSIAVIYAGGQHTCARTNDGAVFCWGSNEYGQLGVGAGLGTTTPVQVAPSCSTDQG
jgi:alpha-tubulin suppressor-like RCC1 family protein